MSTEIDEQRLTDSRQRAGTVLFLLGDLMAILMFIDHTEVLDLRFPGFWYRSRPQHLLICAAAFVGGWWLLRNPRSHDTSVQPLNPVFDSVVLYTRPGCSLCYEALQLLQQHRASFSEVQVVDITGNESLEKEHGEWIPVVSVEGRVRFRGCVDPWLLRRMFEARQQKRHRESSGTTE